MRHILHVDAGREWRGGQQQVLYLLDGLAHRGFRQTLVSPPGSPLAERALSAGHQVIDLQMRGEWDLWSAARLGGIVRENQPDLIHFHDAKSLGVAAWIPASALPTTICSRRVDFAIGRNPFSSRKYRRCSRIIAVSEGVRRVCLDAGLQPEKIEVVHDGVDLDRFARAQDRNSARRAFSLPADEVLIGVVAALVDHKGHRYLIEAMPAILREHPNVRLVLAGEGPLRISLDALAARLGIGNRVIFLGTVADVPQLLASLDLFVLPSHMEGLCQALIEAMAAGVPVVATTAGGIPDLVQDQVSGLLVPPRSPASLASAVSRILSSRGLASTLAGAARLRASELGVERMVAETAQVYANGI